MKKFDDMIEHFDKRIEKFIGPSWAFIQKHFSVFSGVLLLSLLIIFLMRVFSDRSQVLVNVIRDDLDRIESTLEAIDHDCNILDILSSAAQLDFSTVEKFVGSTIGGLNLAHPENWKGPYMDQNPTIQQRFYQIVQAKDGYFVVPGQGVRLPNHLVMGQELKINLHVLVGPMLAKGGRLNYKGQPLGLRVKFKIGDWEATSPSPTSVEKVNEVLQEFNEAMPYAQRSNDNDPSIA
jgi:hypothetical protein